MSDKKLQGCHHQNQPTNIDAAAEKLPAYSVPGQNYWQHISCSWDFTSDKANEDDGDRAASCTTQSSHPTTEATGHEQLNS